MGTTPPRVAASPSPDGGNCIIRDLTRRRHAASHLLLLQTPHSRRHGGHPVADKTSVQHPVARKTRPATPNVGCGERAGRTISRTGHRNIARLKPTTPLLTPNKGPVKPASPLRPQTAPKTPISHPHRRRRFQSHTDTGKQRRSRFQTTGPPGRQGPAAAPAGINVPAAQKTRMQFDWERFQQRLETLQSQRCEVMV